MRPIPQMVDMAMSEEEAAEKYGPSSTTPSSYPKYPYGLCISLCQDELDKLGLDPSDVEVGDMIHLFAMAKITSKSVQDTEGGQNARIEMQITHIASEDEDDEEKPSPNPMKSFYGA